jgi:radial spoke head protein 3
MEVLEEHELQIIKEQSEEYQEIRNAELIEAQRFEAAEQRVADEISRRAVQQKARKAEREAAHKKHIARVVAKRQLEGLREGCLSHIADMGLMSSNLEVQLNERVLPWLMSKVDAFMVEDEQIVQSVFEVVEVGMHKQREHFTKKIVDIK